MSLSLDTLSFKELIEIEAKIADAKTKAKANEIAAFKQECETMAARRGVDIADIFGKLRSKTPVPPKYVHPPSGKTWSGRGRAPRWLHGDRARYVIDGASAQPLKSDGSDTLMGPKAKYRDPASGKTWSGMGRAPFWIVGKDRARFVAG